MFQVKSKLLNGAQITVNTLKRLGVDVVFGYPGSAVLGVYDELSKENSIKHYLVRHEQSAVHAAEGYSCMSAKTGVVLVTSGPGAANIVTAAANAYMDGTPIVIITGQADSKYLGKNAFQEINILDITKSCTKAGFQVRDVNILEETLIKAFELAQTGRKGPVIVDITRDVFSQNIVEKKLYPHVKKTSFPDTYLVRKAENLIKLSQKPVIAAGKGVLNAEVTEKLFCFAKAMNIPVVSTMLGLGAYPANDENYLGMLGIYGDNSANEVLRNADLIIIFGARFNDRIMSKFTDGELTGNIIQVDINPEEIGRNLPVSLGICADLKMFFDNFEYTKRSENEWLRKTQEFKSLNKGSEHVSNLLHSSDAIKEIYKYSEVISTEVGQHQIFTIKNYDGKTKLITSGGFGTMGFGFPAAIGACTAITKPVVCISGDGSFQMSLQELAMCKTYNLPVKLMIFNNGYLGMVRQLQKNNFNSNYYETQIINPDFVKLAESYGIQALRVTNMSMLKAALEKAFSTDAPFVIDIIVEPFEEL